MRGAQSCGGRGVRRLSVEEGAVVVVVVEEEGGGGDVEMEVCGCGWGGGVWIGWGGGSSWGRFLVVIVDMVIDKGGVVVVNVVVGGWVGWDGMGW